MMHSSRVRSVAARMGNEEFFEPLAFTLPRSRLPPWTMSFCMSVFDGGFLVLESCGRRRWRWMSGKNEALDLPQIGGRLNVHESQRLQALAHPKCLIVMQLKGDRTLLRKM